jgi:flagellar motor switch protein FliG
VSTTTRIHLPILIAFAAGLSLAQEGLSRPRDPRDPTDPRTRLERNYERAAHDALARYFSDNTFLVKARVDLDDPDEDVEDLPAPSATRNYPKLPGLPYQPLSLPRADAPLTVQLRTVDLDVLVDTGYTQKDRDFIQYLVTLAGNLDTSRGDLIRVTRAYFPRDDRSLRKPSQPWQEPAPSAVDSSAPDTLSLMDTPLSKLFGQRLISQIPLILVCLTLLVCVWIWRKPAFAALPLSVRSRFRRPGRRAPMLVDPEPDSEPGAHPEPPTARMAFSVAPPKDADSTSGRAFLVNSFIGEPRTSGRILSSWMDRDAEKGAKAAAILLRSLNPKFLDLVREALGEERSSKVERLMGSKDEPSETDLKTVAKGFRKEFLNATQGKRADKEDDLFGFLDQLNEGQIMHILKDEPLGVSGFVLAQVSPAKSGSILQKLDAPTRARFMYAIGNITQIPREIYKEMADRLSLKALEVSNMKFVASDGVESLVQLIESLPIAKQFEYIHSLSEVDLNLARKLRERTVTFPELASLPEKLLAKCLQSADGDTLALSFQAADPTHRARFLQLLPERMQLMVKSSLETRRDPTPSDIEAAQNRLLGIFRDEIRRTGRPS